MAEQQRQLNSETHRECDNTLQKLNTNEEPTDAATIATRASITTIYHDCLDRIFDFLDLESLLNVAGTCKRLQIAAAAKFNDEHGKKSVSLSLRNFYGDLAEFDVSSNHIGVGGFKLCLPSLLCIHQFIDCV